MRQPPWHQRWEIKNMQGILSFDHMLNEYSLKRKAKTINEWWREYDLMEDYRGQIPAEDQRKIFAEMESEQMKYQRRTGSKRRALFNAKSRKLLQPVENPEIDQLAVASR